MSKGEGFGFLLPAITSLRSQFAGLSLVNALLRLGFRIRWASEPFFAHTDVFPNGHSFEPGDFLIESHSGSSDARNHDFAFVKKAAAQRGALVQELFEQCDPIGYLLSVPRIAVYKGTGTWDCYLWYTECLRTMGFSHDCLSPSEISSGKLVGYDAYIQPGGDETWQASALWPGGRDQIRKFIESGGSYLGSCGGLDVAGGENGTTLGSPFSGKVKFLNLVTYKCPRNVRRTEYPHDEWARKYFYHIDFNEYSQMIPVAFGTSVPIRARVKSSPVLFGYGQTIIPGIRYSAGPIAKDLKEPMRSIADFAPDLLPLDSAWAMPPEEAIRLLEGAAAISESTFGKGRLVFFAPHPEDPGNPEYFRMVANALFYLTAEGPGEAHTLKDITSRHGEIHKEKIMASENDFEDIQQMLVKTKHMSQTLRDAWSPIQSLKRWPYRHVPEWLLRLPGYSLVTVPDFQLETLNAHVRDLLALIPELASKHKALLSASRNQGSADATEQAIALVSNVCLNVSRQLRSTHEDMERMHLRLDDLTALVDVITELRREIDSFRQASSGSGRRLDELWHELDSKQSELNDRIWREVVFYLDGKAEVSIYSVWRPEILEKQSRGMLTKLGEMRSAASSALELCEYALTTTR